MDRGQHYHMDYGVFRATLQVSPRCVHGRSTDRELSAPAWQRVQIREMVTCMKCEQSRAAVHEWLLVAKMHLIKASLPPNAHQVGAKPGLSTSSATQHPPRDIRCRRDGVLRPLPAPCTTATTTTTMSTPCRRGVNK